MSNIHFNSNHKETVTNYPYGSMKATAFFSTEFKAGKGFRSVFQTINPKTGRLNAEKKSTYYPVLIMYKDGDTGHIKHKALDFYDTDGINKCCARMAEYFELFTPAEIKDIYTHILLKLKAQFVSYVGYTGADKDKTLELLKPVMDTAMKGYKDGGNVFASIVIDGPALEALKVPDYQPFKITTYAPLSQLVK